MATAAKPENGECGTVITAGHHNLVRLKFGSGDCTGSLVMKLSEDSNTMSGDIAVKDNDYQGHQASTAMSNHAHHHHHHQHHLHAATMATMAEENEGDEDLTEIEPLTGTRTPASAPIDIHLDELCHPLSSAMQHGMLCHRQRHLSYSPSTKRRMEAILGTSPPSPLRLARDPVQPRMGSIPDIHREGDDVDGEDSAFAEDNEVRDTFSESASFRPRSKTCPENRSWVRRAKARARANLNRPPTPPPGCADDCDVEQQLSRLALKGKLKIPTRNLPKLPESNTDSGTAKPISNADNDTTFPIEGV